MIFFTLLAKEFKEGLRTYRWAIAVVVFLLLGISSPLVIRFLPEIVKEAQSSGFQVQLPEQTAQDAMDSYIKNMSQLAVITVILLSMGAITEERRRGLAAFVLTKPASRASYFLAKYMAYVLAFLVASVLTAVVAGYYTSFLFVTPYDVAHFIQINVLIFVFYLLILALNFFFGSFLRHSLAAGGLTFLVYIVIVTLPSIPSPNGILWNYSPAVILDRSYNLMRDQVTFNSFGVPVAVSLALAVGLLTAGWWLFERQDI